MALLYSKVYAPGGIYLSLQLIAFCLMAFLDLFFHVLMAANKYYLSAGILLVLIPFCMLFNVILIPKFGAVGAACSLVLTMFLGMVIAMVLVCRLFGSPMKLTTLTRVIVVTALTMLVGSQISLVGPWLLLKFVVLLGLYALFLSLFKELSWEDLKPFAVWQKSLS
jgi:O-antigen/teichoic acid export membrane protein